MRRCGGTIKPDVVLYEEGLDNDVIEQSLHYISQADMLIIGGTSLVVYPAAGLVRYYRGKKLVLINKSTTDMDSAADWSSTMPSATSSATLNSDRIIFHANETAPTGFLIKPVGAVCCI